ncbi:MAG: hypothetical protein WBQ73_03450 [Candidatus Babeliales bacterium]
MLKKYIVLLSYVLCVGQLSGSSYGDVGLLVSSAKQGALSSLATVKKLVQDYPVASATSVLVPAVCYLGLRYYVRSSMIQEQKELGEIINNSDDTNVKLAVMLLINKDKKAKFEGLENKYRELRNLLLLKGTE